MIFLEKLQLDCYTVPELPLSRNPLHNCTLFITLAVFVDILFFVYSVF